MAKGCAVVTGGSSGIGQGIAQVLAGAGYRVAICYSQNEEGARETVRRIREAGGECRAFFADFSRAGAPDDLVRQAAEAFGDIEIFVNNAGVCRFANILTAQIEEIDQLIAVDFRGMLLGMQAAGRHMAARGIKGSIVNITSSRAERAYPGDSVYGGCKAAVMRATQSAALDLAPYGIRVNCVAPGATRVRQGNDEFYQSLGARIPCARMGTPEDCGKAVLYLSCADASYITGVTLRVDGGLILSGMPERIDAEAEFIGWGYSRPIDVSQWK